MLNLHTQNHGNAYPVKGVKIDHNYKEHLV